MNNLINNAIKHTDEGHIRFGYKKEENNVRFYVEDTGEGIPKDQLNTIFIRFTQLNEANKSVSGVGLGLAICKGILKQMDGTISVTSTMKLNYNDINLLPFIEDIYYSNQSKVPANVVLQMQPCENFVIYSDHLRLSQIITNLINYAIQHTNEGYIRIGYQIKQKGVQFFVEDTGEGIANDKIDTIFEHSSQLNQWNNTDLSLVICKGLTILLGGTISLTSILGKGSTFFVTLPINKKEENQNE